MIKYILITSLVIGALCLAIFFYSWYRLHTSFSIRPAEGKQTPTDYGLSYETKHLTTSDGKKIAAWYIPVPDPKAVVILVHGYKEIDAGRSTMLPHAKYLNDAGYSTLLVSLRSFGESEGDKITFGVQEWRDAEAGYDFLKSMPENTGKKIGFLGISMGASVVLVAAGQTQKVDFVIAAGPYADFIRLYEFILRQEKLPPEIFLPFVRTVLFLELGANYQEYTPAALIKKVNAPLLLMSGKHDREVNSKDAKYLFDRGQLPKEYWQADATHQIFHDQPEEFRKRVLRFLEKVE